jgi:hypothetical protein
LTGSDTRWHHQKLQGSAPTGNVQASQFDSSANRIRALAQTSLQAGQVEIGGPLLRQYLEFVLGQIISKLNVLVPLDYAIKSDKKMVGNGLDILKNAIDLHRSANQLVLTAQQQEDFNNRHVPAIIANYVSHYETGGGAPINADVLLGVLQSMDDLSECFRYDDTSQTPSVRRWYKSLSRF